jgi:hypothetical protein
MGKPLKSLLALIRNLREINSREGGLLPFSMAAKLMGLSKQRVNALVAEGTLKPVEFAGKKWLTANQIEEFIKLKREPGRPWNKPSTKELWKMSHQGALDQLAGKREEKAATQPRGRTASS